ncbi:MAG: hypothetical protein HOQ36_21795, partial [Nocardia sp.]|nr:hypothetical protein [Nocardia sp.]
MTLFVALVGVGTFGFITYDYIVHESRLGEMLERYRPLGSVADDAANRYDLERMHRDLEAVRSYRER